MSDFYREFAAAVLLVVEVVFAEQLVTAFVETALAPVLRPEFGIGDGGLGFQSGGGNLLDALPARRCQRGGKEVQALTTGFTGCCREAKLEAQAAAAAALGFALQSADAVEPLLVVVVAINPLDT